MAINQHSRVQEMKMVIKYSMVFDKDFMRVVIWRFGGSGGSARSKVSAHSEYSLVPSKSTGIWFSFNAIKTISFSLQSA
jgi:hypothetical protein